MVNEVEINPKKRETCIVTALTSTENLRLVIKRDGRKLTKGLLSKLYLDTYKSIMQ